MLAAPSITVVEDIVTWYPADPGAAAMIRFVVRPVWPAALVRYTQVLPTATGNGIELVFANDPEAGPWPVPVTEVALCFPLGCPLDRPLCGPLAGVAVLCGPVLAGDAPDASVEACADVSPGTSGWVPVPAPLHPARAMRAAAARAARTA